MILLAGGIVLAPVFRIPAIVSYSFLGATFLCGLFFFKQSFSGILLYISILLCGQHLATPPPFHTETYGISTLHCRCKETLSSNSYILSVADRLLYLRLPDTVSGYRAGDSLKIQGRLIRLKIIANIDAFNYNRYLKQKNIHFRIYPVAPVIKTGHSTNLYTFFQDIRQKLISKIDSLITHPRQQAVVKALCLGYKNELDKDTRTLFSSTGTIHLLAVSGLHTGAVYLLLCYLFRFLGLKHPKSHLVIIPLLWCYACLTGLSPSVIRAANILSFIIIGKAFAQDYTPLNSIAASAFFTLIFQPEALYSISMQMSYAAYSGIVLLYPLSKKFSSHIPTFLKPIYALLSVTLSAQLATTPLSIYYFHTFNPGSPLINLIAVPLTTLLFYSALLTLLLPLCIGLKISCITEYLCSALFFCLDKSGISHLNINNLYPTIGHTLFFYFQLFLLVLYLSERKKAIFRFLLLNGCCWLIYICFFNIHIRNRQEIITYHLYGKSCILLNYNGYYTFLHNTSDSSDQKTIFPYIYYNRLISPGPDKSIITADFLYTHPQFINKKYNIGLITSDKDFPYPNTRLWIVSGNIFPDQVRQDTSRLPRQIIVDASNRPTCIRKWESFCRNHSIELLKTEEHGAIQIPLKQPFQNREQTISIQK